MRSALFLFLLFSLNLQAQETSPSFVEGVKAYQDKDYQKSQEIFSQLLTQYPQNPTVIYNLGLAEYGLGKKGLALGLWRKARFLDSSLSPANKAIQFAEAELFPDSQRSDVFYVIYSWLKKIPLHLWILFSFLSFFCFFWFAITFSAQRKIPFTQWPYWQFLLIPTLIFTSGFSIFLSLETSKVRATVAINDATTKTGPSETAPTLSNLVEGELLTVENKSEGWAQIKTMTGAPGWVEIKNIIILER